MKKKSLPWYSGVLLAPYILTWLSNFSIHVKMGGFAVTTDIEKANSYHWLESTHSRSCVSNFSQTIDVLLLLQRHTNITRSYFIIQYYTSEGEERLKERVKMRR